MLQIKRSGKIRAAFVTNKVVEFPASRDQRLEEAIGFYYSCRFPEALDRLISLINAGCDEAYYYVGCIYEEGGNGVEKDVDKALFYYEKSVNEFGYVEGYLALGRLYYFGIGVPQDYHKALELFSIVAEKANNGIAQMMLGRMYQYGHGVEKNLVRAREYYQAAWNQNYVFALTHLALLEQECRNYLKALWLRARATYLAFKITLCNPHDRRLRRS